MDEVVKSALNEWRILADKNDHEGVKKFRRKVYEAHTVGAISAEELHAIFDAIENEKHENFLKMYKNDIEVIVKTVKAFV